MSSLSMRLLNGLGTTTCACDGSDMDPSCVASCAIDGGITDGSGSTYTPNCYCDGTDTDPTCAAACKTAGAAADSPWYDKAWSWIKGQGWGVHPIGPTYSQPTPWYQSPGFLIIAGAAVVGGGIYLAKRK